MDCFKIYAILLVALTPLIFLFQKVKYKKNKKKDSDCRRLQEDLVFCFCKYWKFINTRLIMNYILCVFGVWIYAS